MDERDLINRQSAIEMAEKIVDEIDGLDCDLEAKKTWARKLIESILPVSEVIDSETGVSKRTECIARIRALQYQLAEANSNVRDLLKVVRCLQ